MADGAVKLVHVSCGGIANARSHAAQDKLEVCSRSAAFLMGVAMHDESRLLVKGLNTLLAAELMILSESQIVAF